MIFFILFSFNINILRARIRALENRFKPLPPTELFVTTDRSDAVLLLFIFLFRVLSVCLSVVLVGVFFMVELLLFLFGSCLVS